MHVQLDDLVRRAVGRVGDGHGGGEGLAGEELPPVEGQVAAVVSLRSRGRQEATPARSGAWGRDLAAAGRRAVITVTTELGAADLAALSRARIPLVVIDPFDLPQARVTSVGSTNFLGGLAATRYLLDLGHRMIAYLGGPAAAACNQARMHGYRGALEGAGVSIPEGYVRTGRFHHRDGLVEGGTLLDLPQRPTAVFAGSDETALGVVEAARARGLRVPEDLSIVGFDDTPVAEFASPPLTTVRQPLREIGAVALRTALRLADGEKVDSHHVELATELVVRNDPGELTAAYPPERMLEPPGPAGWEGARLTALASVHAGSAVLAGHIRELPSGRFQAIAYAGIDPLTGKERYERETAP